jgi:hypothetical protein
MAITSKGYERALTYAELGVLLQHAGAQYSVFSADSFAASVGVGDRVVSLQAGSAAGQGIFDTSDAPVPLIGAPVTAGDRWDLVALRRDWSAKTTTPVLLQGTASFALPAARVSNPGVQDDQPLWLIRFSAGQAAAQEFIDLRVWHGDGGCFAKSRMVRDFLTRIGTRIYITDRTYVLTVNSAGVPTWVTDSVITSTTAPSPADVPWLQIPA